MEFREAFDLIENVLYYSDRRDIEYASGVMKLSNIVADAAKERIRNYRHERLRITKVSNGSIIFEGAIATAALYVLKKTLADPLENAYKNSNAYSELTTFFRHIIDEKTIFITKKLREASRRRGYIPDVRHEIKSPDVPRHIYMELRREDEMKKRRIPTLGEELDKNA